MVGSIVDGVAYLVGLFLLVMPAESIPYFDGRKGNVRVGKHLLGLILFAAATIRIHRTIQADAGIGFILASAFLILIISVFKTWKEKRS